MDRVNESKKDKETRKARKGNQFLLLLFYIIEKLFIFLLRANICLTLRYFLDMTEARATLYFHLFELTVYFSAFFFGQLAMYSFGLMMLLAPCFYGGAAALVSLMFDSMNKDNDMATMMLLLGLLVTALGHGTNMATYLKVVEFELATLVIRFVVVFSSIIDMVVCFLLPHLFFKLEADVNSTIYSVFMGFLCALIPLQVLLLCSNLGVSKNFTEYGPWTHISCLFYRTLQNIFEFLTPDGRKRIKSREKTHGIMKSFWWKHSRNVPLTKDELKTADDYHWLDAAIPAYPKEFIKDMNYKVNYLLLMASLPGIFVVFELRYSFWLFSMERLDRYYEDMVLPAQAMLSINLAAIIGFLLVYSLIFVRVLRRLKVNTNIKRMILGSVFLLASIGCAILMISRQDWTNIRPNEPYFDQTKIVVRNGVNCKLSITDRMNYMDQQWSFRVTQNATASSRIPKKSELTDHHSVNSALEDFIEKKYKNFTDDDEILQPIIDQVGDTSTFYLTLTNGTPEHAQTMNVFPVNCNNDFQYNVPFQGPLDDLRFGNKLKMMLITPSTVESIEVPFTRPVRVDPGLRFFFANETPVKNFQVKKYNKSILYFGALRNLTRDFYFLKDGDGFNIAFFVDNTTMNMNYSVHEGGLYDVVFMETNGKIRSFKMYQAEAPHTISIWFGLPQYVGLGIGEFFFGVLGLRFFFSQTPKKLHYHTLCDWRLMHAISNAIIIIVLQCGLVITIFWQAAVISTITCISIFWFIVFAFFYEYKYPPEMVSEEQYDKK